MAPYGDNYRPINGLEIPRGSLQFHTHHYFPLRGEGRDVLAVPVVQPVCFLSLLSHTGLRAQSAPGFPCALFKERDNEIEKLGQIVPRE